MTVSWRDGEDGMLGFLFGIVDRHHALEDRCYRLEREAAAAQRLAEKRLTLIAEQQRTIDRLIAENGALAQVVIDHQRCAPDTSPIPLSALVGRRTA